MNLMSNKPSLPSPRLQNHSDYLLAGFILIIGIYFLAQGIAQLW
jgi:hypothetical protein